MSATPAPETIQSILERAKILYTVKEISAKLSVDAKTISRWIKNEATPSALMIPGIKEALFGKPSAPKPADFTFIDLFAGIGGIRLGFESAGGRCVFTSEWNKHSQKTYMTNFMDDHPIAGDITKLDADAIPDHDVLVGGFPCFAKGTLVHAFDGLRPIETIREGDMVLGQSGEFRRVGAAMVKHGAPTRQLRIMGCPELTTTDEHPFWARRSVLTWNPTHGKYEREMSPAAWVDAQDLNGDHFVGLPMDQEMESLTSNLIEEQKSPAFWFAVGQWLGHETHAAEYIRPFISDFESNPSKRELPGYCFHMSKALQSSLWQGWMSAQGEQSMSDAQHGITSSEKLALGMARIARNVFATSPTIRKQEPSGEKSTWRLILSTRPSPHFFFDGSFVWAKVRKNQTTGQTETVHNIAVDVDESYVVEGALVHNCQPFSIAGVSKKASMGRKHGFEDKTQGTLFFDVARIIKAKRPKAFMLENVKNLLSHDKGNTFKVIKETLEKDLGYTISHRVIDGQHFTPQHRERILIVGFREDVGFDFSKLALPAQGPKLASILHPQNGTEKITDDCISGAKGIIGAKYTITDNLWAYLQAYAAKHKAAGNGFGFGMVGPQSVTRTLSARYYKDGSEILVDQGKKKNPRRLTPRECARLQGFPDHYKIPVSDSQAYKQFGNSVVVPVMAAVAAHMKPHLMGLIAAQATPAAPTASTKKKK